MKSPFSPVDALPTEGGATHQELDRLLARLKIAPANGLESRVLARLDAHSASEALRRPAPWSRGWAPAAIAASLFCVFAGGALVARQTSAVTRVEPEAHPAIVSAQQTMPHAAMSGIHGGPGVATAAIPSVRSMDTAAARRKPSTQIFAGRRRGRAMTSAVSK